VRRRELITLVGGALVAWPLAGRAQHAEHPARIGFLPIGSPFNRYDQSRVDAFRQGLLDVGLVENRHVTVDIVWVDKEPEISRGITELLQRGTKVLVTVGSNASAAAKRQTSTIPIVFVSVGNPIGIGLVESLSHPGGNATGFSDVLSDLSGKYVDLAREMNQPQAAVDYLWHTGWSDGKQRFQDTERAARASGVELRSRGINDIAEVDDAIAALKTGGAVTIIIQPGPFTYQHRKRLIDTAMNYGVATIFAFSPAANDGA
jgi:ABC-type uncharacterized transport system substrate-binding protein